MQSNNIRQILDFFNLPDNIPTNIDTKLTVICCQTDTNDRQLTMTIVDQMNKIGK